MKQPSEAQIDYSAVEQALAHNEAPARMRIMTGQGLRALAVCGGLAILALSAGYAWHMAKDPKIETVEKIVEVEVPAPPVPQAPAQKPGGSKIVRNYVIFQSVEAEMVAKGISVHAGHNYETSTQSTYSDAFCYVLKDMPTDGSEVKISLSWKEPGESPELAPANGSPLGLSPSDITELQGLCPFL